MRYDNTVRATEEQWDRMPGLMIEHEQILPYLEPSRGMSQLEGNPSLQRALWRLFEKEGKQVTITFDLQASTSVGERSKAATQTAVVASVLLPFGWEDLVARVTSAQGEESLSVAKNVFHFGDVRVDFSAMEVIRKSGSRISLTAQEFKMLRFFLVNPGRVISREELLNEAWGYENYPCTRTVDNHVLRLRQKLEIDPSQPVHFQTVIRVGYKFVPGVQTRERNDVLGSQQ